MSESLAFLKQHTLHVSSFAPTCPGSSLPAPHAASTGAAVTIGFISIVARHSGTFAPAVISLTISGTDSAGASAAALPSFTRSAARRQHRRRRAGARLLVLAAVADGEEAAHGGDVAGRAGVGEPRHRDAILRAGTTSAAKAERRKDAISEASQARFTLAQIAFHACVEEEL